MIDVMGIVHLLGQVLIAGLAAILVMLVFVIIAEMLTEVR